MNFIELRMLAVEKEVKAFIRKYGPLSYIGCSLRFLKALDRLLEKGEVRWSKSEGGYILTKGKS